MGPNYLSRGRIHDERTAAEIQGILDAIRAVVRSLRESSRRAEDAMGISGAQLFVLQRLSQEEEPLSMNEIAARTFTHQSSVSAVVKRLVERGLARSSPSSRDARRVELRVTEEGKALLKRSPGAMQERLLASLARLPARTLRALHLGLGALIKEMEIDSARPEMFFEETASSERRMSTPRRSPSPRRRRSPLGH